MTDVGCRDITVSYVRFFREAVGPNFISKHYNAWPDRALVDECLESWDIRMVDWPIRSTDLKLIENVSDALRRKTGTRFLPPIPSKA